MYYIPYQITPLPALNPLNTNEKKALRTDVWVCLEIRDSK